MGFWFEVLAIIFSISLFSAKSQLSVTWNGTTITGPVLIYADELPVNSSASRVGDPNSPGALMCRYEGSGKVSWHYTRGIFVENETFRAIATKEGVAPSMSQLLLNRPIPDNEINDTNINGVWHCRLNASGIQDYHRDDPARYNDQVNIGIYYRKEGHGVITNNTLYFLSSSFESNPPTFILVGDTSGGPPTNYTWTRNGEVITDGGPYSISIELGGGVRRQTSINSHYHSTLTVTGCRPGVYQYSVANRATTTTKTSILYIGGGTNSSAVQSGFDMIQVSWTAQPSTQYCIAVDPGGISVTATMSPYNIPTQRLLPGVYNITVISLSSQQVLNMPVRQVEIVLKGALHPDITHSSVTSTSSIVSWTQPPLSFTPVGYIVTLTQLTESGKMVNVDTMNTIRHLPSNVTSMEFICLKEYSSYRINVTVLFNEFGTSYAQFSLLDFATVSTGTVPGVNCTIVSDNATPTSPPTCHDTNTSANISTAVILTFVLTITLYTAVLLIGCGIILRVHKSKKSSGSKGEAVQPAVYEEVDSKSKAIHDNDMAMIENAAYGPMTVTQLPAYSTKHD